MLQYCLDCRHGTKSPAPVCRWCGSSRLSQSTTPPVAACDTECYIDYWLCRLGDFSFELYPGSPPLDAGSLRRELTRHRIVTFNGNHYDMPMIALALTGASTEVLKHASDRIIQENLKSWQFYDAYGLPKMDWIDHVDLFEVAPGQGSLKAYGGKMHSKRLQDLPYEPHESIDPMKRINLFTYCANDQQLTLDLYEAMSAQVKLREDMSAEYGIDLLSKSDAQIAESVLKKILPFKPRPPEVTPGRQFFYQPPEWMSFLKLDVLDVLARSPFTIKHTGYVDMAVELAETVIRIGDSAYQMGSGGLHSTEERQIYRTDDHVEVKDIDVRSFYPSIIIRLKVCPEQVGYAFIEIYQGWYTIRLDAKDAGNKKVANSLKTLLNGTFGKLLSQYSIVYYPEGGMQVTITGQLSLLMLIESLEAVGVKVISANTDGIVTVCPHHLKPLRDHIVKQWEQRTGFATEDTFYRVIASRDVNSYIAITMDGKAKLKGAYAPPEPGPSGWPNPSGDICVDAVVAYLKDGVPLRKTIMECVDVRKFLYVRKVAGGGVWRDEYLGKTVRWYHVREAGAPITYKTNGKKVSNTDRCRPLMELPDNMLVPRDVDYGQYILEANRILNEIGANDENRISAF